MVRAMDNTRAQFSLRMLFWLVLACAALSAAIRSYGAVAAVAGICFLVAAVVWGFALARAPDLAKHATVTIVLGTVLLAALVGWIGQTREQARKRACVYHLYQLGFDIWHEKELHPSRR